MKMAAPAQGWLLPSLKGLLLLCTLALLLCIQHPGATAEGNVATSNSLVATRTTSLATRTTPVATNPASVTASTISGVATKTSSAPARTTKLATRTTPVATHTTKLATRTTPVATHTTKLATRTTPVATHTTKLATRTTPVATHTTKLATRTTPVATHTTTWATSTTSVATNPASVTASTSLVVATNSSGKSEEETRLTCQSFQCSGERCYQDESHANSTVTCATRSHCQLYRFSSTNYSAGCSSTCSSELCRANSSGSTQRCALDCCSSSLCLRLNASSYGDLPATTTLPAPTTTRAPPRNGKVCAAFSCHGEGCFRGKKTVAKCIVGQDFCQMKKMGLNFVAGCSRACQDAKPICASKVKAACYQECCSASLKSSCLKLDGKVHINSAGQVALAPLLKLVACGVALLLSHRLSAAPWE